MTRSTIVDRLPRDLDGDPYRVDETLGPWKVSRCCGAFLTGTDDGVVCRMCYGDPGMDDGPAHLPTTPTEETT